MVAASPHSLAVSYLDELKQQLPLVRDGDVEGIHQARVATRRLREVLPLLRGMRSRDVERWVETARAAGRQLGRARDIDVMHELLLRHEIRVPATAAVAAVARATLAQRRHAAHRKLIKRLERLDIDRLVAGAQMLSSRWAAAKEQLASGPWSSELRGRIGSSASRLRTAVGHASGVYLPNRAHGVRVALKKLRYSVDAGGDTGVWQPPRLARDLRRIQSTLGRLHDVQVLIDSLDELVGDSSVRADLPMLIGALRGEAAEHHTEYLRRRERVLTICDVCERFARPPSTIGRAARATAIAVAVASQAAVLLLGARELTEESSRDRGVRRTG